MQVFDFFLVVLSFINLFRGLIPINITALRMIRSLKILRSFRSIKALQGLLNLLKSLYEQWKAILLTIMLSTLIIFTFSLLAMNIFGDVREGQNGGISELVNFRSFYDSFNLLWVCSTGEGWNMVMYDSMLAKGNHAAVFWLFYMILMVFVFLNIIVAVIFENLEG